MTTYTSDIVVAGAGPVGMTLAISAAMRGLSVTVVEERQAGAPASAKCNTIAARTMEIFRTLGVADAIRASGLTDDYPTDTLYATSITGPEIARLRFPSRNERDKPGFLDSHWRTPEPVVRASQLYLEPILYARMREIPRITVLNGVTAARYAQDGAGVTLTAQDAGGGEITLRGRFLAGCDGGRSTIRRLMGVKLEGDAELARTRSTLLRAPELKALWGRRRPAWMTWVVNHKVRGNVVAIDGEAVWLVHRAVPDDAADFGDLDFDQSIRDTLGVGPEFAWEVLSHDDWTGRRLVAERFRDGRVFLAGDAAHIWMPYGGYGMNAGVADAANLAWVLSAVANGWAGPDFLDVYEAERRPITEQVSRLAIAKVQENADATGRRAIPKALSSRGPAGLLMRAILGPKLYRTNVPQFAPEGLNFGYFYEASPVIAYDGDAPPAYSMGEAKPSTVPGCRMPHFWTDDGSIYDRLGPDYTLIRFDAAADVEPIAAAAARARLPLRIIDAERPADLAQAFATRMLVVRHDQQVAWRGDAAPADVEALVRRLQGGQAPAPASRARRVEASQA